MTHPFRAGQTVDAYLAEHGGSGAVDKLADLYDFYGIDPNSSAGRLIRQRIEGGEVANDVFLEVAALSQTGPFAPTTPSGGTGGSAPAFSSTQAAADLAFQQQQTLDAQAAKDQIAFLQEQERLATISGDRARAADFRNQIDLLERQQGFTAEENRLAEEAALKRQRLGVLSSLISDFVGAQSQARDTLANLQPDPFRFAAVSGGAAPFGATPQQGFQGQLQNLISAPVPTADPSGSAASLEQAIGQLQGFQAPTAPVPFGAAGGASIPLPAPGQSVAVRVGEEGEEILKVSAQGVEVIPLGGNFAHGGTIGDFNFQEIPFNRESLLPASVGSAAGFVSSAGASTVSVWGASAVSAGVGTSVVVGVSTSSI